MFDITGAFTPTHAGRQLLWMGYSALVHRTRIFKTNFREVQHGENLH